MGFREWLLAAGMAVSSLTGCMMNAAPVKDFFEKEAEYIRRGETPPSEGFTVRPEFQFGAKGAYVKTKLPESMRTTDGTTTRSPCGFDIRPTAGALVSAGSWLRVFAGAEAEWGASTEVKSRHRPYEEADHAMESPEQSPIVFTEVMQPYSIKPLAGIEARVGSFKLRIDARMPYSRIDVESGYLRRDGTDPSESASWKGWGKGAGASILYGGNSFRGGLFCEAEKFEPEDFGKGSVVESILGLIQLEYRF